MQYNIGVDEAPTADGRKIAHWIDEGEGDHTCSNCGNTMEWFTFPYCPYCGAKMEKTENDSNQKE